MAKLNNWDRKHINNIAYYQAKLDEIYKEAVREAASLGASVRNFNADNIFSFKDYPSTKKKLNKLLNVLYSRLRTVIVDGISSEWTLANNKNNELCNQVFGDNKNKLTKAEIRKYYNNNTSALKTFQERKENGLNLSDRVWRYTNQFKEEIEMGLDLGIRSGRSADEIAKDLQQYLKYPDKLFRRVRDEHGVLHLSKKAAAFHPGKGVYRSSYKNARRLAATETNIAYRTADHLRWQQLDFVVGIKVQLSNNHTVRNSKGKLVKLVDICDTLAGKYPKDFKFVGWHPHCRCFATPILKTEEEMEAENELIAKGEEPTITSNNFVEDVPEDFKDWMTSNENRMQSTASVPYFISDNPKYTGVQPHYGAVGAVTGTKLGRTATKEAFKVYENLPAPTLTAAVTANTEAIAKDFGIKTKPKPMTFLEANYGRGNVYFGRGNEFEENCQAAVVVHEARLRGLDVTALGYNNTKGSASYELGEHFESIWENPKTGKTPSPTELRGDSFDDMLGKIDKATKAIGRYHIGINMASNNGHVITAERLSDGQITYYDAQNGAFLNLEEYADRGVEYLEVLKVDKLILRRDIFKQIAHLL